jgi:cytochrome c
MSYRWPLLSALVLVALSMGVAPVRADGDPEAGATVFKKCAACHNADEKKNKVGPYLVGIFGRPAGSVEGFKYSKAMSESGIVWSEETISEYVKQPKMFLKGNRMAFAGLKKDEDVANLIAYLKQATAE